MVHPALRKKQLERKEHQEQAQAEQTQSLPKHNPFAPKEHSGEPPEEPKPQQRSQPDIFKAPESDGLRKFPRPLLTSDESSLEHTHSFDQFENVPRLYYEHTSVDQGSAPCRFARSSCYAVPESSSALAKSEYRLAVVFTPFAEQTESEEQVPVSDKREVPILRCERCRAFVNPGFVFKDNYLKYACNLCEFEGSVPPNCFDLSTQLQLQYPETKNAVYDFIVPESFRQREVRRHNVLVVLDMSFESVVNSSFFHVLANLTAILDTLEEDTGVGFVTFDSTVSFYKAEEEEEEEDISIIKCADPEAPATLSHAELFLSPKKDRVRLDKLIAFLQKFAESRYTLTANELKNANHCFDTLAKTLCEIFKEGPGHVLLFTSANRKAGGGKSNPTAPFLPKESPFSKHSEVLLAMGVTVDLFATTERQIDLAALAALSTETGGAVHFYNNFRPATHAESFYYDTYRAVTVFRALDVVCRLRVSSGLQILSYFTPKGKVHTLDFALSSLTSDQHVVANLQLGENLKGRKSVSVQLVSLYNNSFGVCLMRIVNLSLKVTADMNVFFKQLDCEAYTYVFLRHGAFLLASKSSAETTELLMKEAHKMFKYYRYDIGGRYEAKEFALPDRIKHFPLYLSSVLSRAAFNQKAYVNNEDFNFFSLLAMTQLHMSKLVFNLYPKVFDLDKLFEEFKAEKTKVGSVGANGLPVLPNSVAANSLLLKANSVFLIDNGLNVFLTVRNGASEQLVAELLGVETVAKLETPAPIPTLATEFNELVHAVINRLRGIKNGAIQATLLISENDENSYRVRNSFVEDAATSLTSNYWDFLTQLHERVKDD